MSNNSSATMSGDEGDDNTEVGSSDGSDYEREPAITANGPVDISKTSDIFLTLKDEPNDFMITRPPAFADDDNVADDEEEGELEEVEGIDVQTNRKTGNAAEKAVGLYSLPDSSSDVTMASDRIIAVPTAFKAESTLPAETPKAVPTSQSKMKIPIVTTTTVSTLGSKSQTARADASQSNDKQMKSTMLQQQSASEGQSKPASGASDTMLDGCLKKRVKKKRKNLWICLGNCKYDVVHRMAKKYGFKICDEEDDWNLFWTDFSVGLERVMDMKRYQKINHFPGMSELCRKDLLARNLNKMLKLFSKDYTFFPRTWVLPADYGDLQAYARTKKSQTYIIKPPASCQGRGIWLTKNASKIKASEHAVVQTYLRKPFLIDGFKFDLRVYVTVTSCDPLRIFVFKDGLARFATCKYVDPSSNNCDNVFMHVTNYAVQKNSDTYLDDEYSGTKRRISTINRWLRENGYNVEKLWQEIDDIAIKTVISAQPVLRHNYRTCFPNHVQGSACFEVLGFDIVLDRKLRPYVLEVNHSPSFTTDAQIDLDIKEALIYDTLDLINICGVDRKKCLEDDKRRVKERLLQRQTKKDLQEEVEREAEAWSLEQERYEAAHMGNYRRIYPIPGLTEKYDKYFQNSGSLFAETAAFRARQECARQQREDLTRKQDQLAALLKKNKDRTLRPESPERSNGTQQVKRRIIRRPPLAQKRLAQMNPEEYNLSENALSSAGSLLQANATFDIMRPIGIIDDEEVERLSGLIQRENLIRSLGVVEQVYRMLHGTPGTVSSVKSQPVGGGQGGAQNRLPLAQYPNNLATSKQSSSNMKKAQLVVPVGICLLPSKNPVANVAVTGVPAGQLVKPRPARITQPEAINADQLNGVSAAGDTNSINTSRAIVTTQFGVASDGGTMQSNSIGSGIMNRKGQSNVTSDSGYDGRVAAGYRNMQAQQQQQLQTKRAVGQAVAQLHIVNGPAELQTLNRPISTYYSSDSSSATTSQHWRSAQAMPNLEAYKMNQKRAVTYSAAVNSRKSVQVPSMNDQAVAMLGMTDRGEMPLGAHMRKLLSMQGSIESVLPQSLQNPLKQNSVPLQSSDLIQYQHHTGAAGFNPFITSMRKVSGSGYVNSDRQEFNWMDDSHAKENVSGRQKSSQRISQPNGQPSAKMNLDWQLTDAAASNTYGLQLKGLSLKAPQP